MGIVNLYFPISYNLAQYKQNMPTVTDFVKNCQFTLSYSSWSLGSILFWDYKYIKLPDLVSINIINNVSITVHKLGINFIKANCRKVTFSGSRKART